MIRNDYTVNAVYIHKLYSQTETLYDTNTGGEVKQLSDPNGSENLFTSQPVLLEILI